MYNLNSETWTELSETKGTFLNKDTGNGIYLVDSATEPESEDDAITLNPGEKRYLKASSGKIYAKSVRGEAKLATPGFSSSSGELEEQIQSCLPLGYEYGGILAEQTEVIEDYVYKAYTDDTDGTYYLCNSSKSWTLGDDNPDSDFDESTSKAISDKVENLSDEIFYKDFSKKDVTNLGAGAFSIDVSEFVSPDFLEIVFYTWRAPSGEVSKIEICEATAGGFHTAKINSNRGFTATVTYSDGILTVTSNVTTTNYTNIDCYIRKYKFD